MSPWRIVDVDVSHGARDIEGDGRCLLVFWWRGLPLGCRALAAAEMPFRAALVEAMAADMIGDQLAARLPELGAPWRAGVDGQPLSAIPLVSAARAPDLLGRLDAIAAEAAPGAERLSVIVCTRDRPTELAGCLASLAAQDNPPGQIIVVDNAAGRSAEAACAGRPGVTYVHEPRPGLSRARNTGVSVARGELVAFTDDDVELSPNWTGEIVRAFRHPEVDAVTGLVLPARLDTDAQAAFQLHFGGFTSSFQPLRFDSRFLAATRAMGPQVWRIGAGANMAFRRRVFAALGGFDERLGAGASGCSEDSEYWYRILASGGVCLYEPRAYVRHHHRADWPALRRQIRAYMQGHVSALVAQADRYGPSGDAARVFTQLPVHFVKTGLGGVQTLSGWRLRLLCEEVLGWLVGVQYFLRPAWRRRGRAASRPPMQEGPKTAIARHA
jgi:GT2 family glycosyltransferase